MLTRRDVLAAFLGMPVALAACRAGSGGGLPEGEIVGAADVFGHRLRDRTGVVPAVDAWQTVDVVIVGAGVAGLSAARALMRAGIDDFVILELERQPGGTARSGSSPVIAYPWGAHYVPAPLQENVELIELLDEMGVVEGRNNQGDPIVAEHVLCRDPEERLFYRDRWYEGLYLHAGASADDLAQFGAFNKEVDHWVEWRDGRGRRAFTIPIAACSDDAEAKELDRISMTAWLDERGLRSARLRWLVDYSCRDDYGLTADQTSAWAGLFYFASRLKKAGDEAQSLLTWPEGNGRIVTHLVGQVGAKVRLGLAAAEIVSAGTDSQPAVEVVAIDDRAQAAVGFRARRVIFAAPQFLSPHVIRDYRERPPAHVAEFEYGAWMVGNLHLKDRPQSRGFPLAWDNVLYDSPSLGYVVATHQRGLDRGPTVFTYYYALCDAEPKAARQRLLDASREEWADVALTDLSRAHPDIRSLAERFDVMRWGHAMIRPRPGFVWGRAREAASRPYRGIHFAHSDLSGIALFEEAFHHGLRAAAEVAAALRFGKRE